MKALALLLIPAALAWPSLPARAADDATCDRYAAEATSEAAQNTVKMCGFTGPAWGTDPVRDYNGHLNWCLAANKESVDKEASVRRTLIDMCSRCTDYAQKAVAAYDEQDKLFCGNPGGPRWSKDYNSHFKWCLGKDFNVVYAETSARSLFVGKCEVCDGYAKDAMRARQEAINNKCEISGARWSGHIGGHKSWCIENGMTIVGETSSSRGTNAWKSEKQARDAELAECKQCRDYARQAAEQSKKARLCYGLKGSMWSTNETRHFDRCMDMDDGGRDAETKQQAEARAKALGECTVGATPRPTDPAMAVRSGAGSSKSKASKELRSPQTGATRSTPPCVSGSGQPCRPAGSSSRSSGTSAMDRLGGGSSMPDSSAAGAAPRGARPAAPAARSGGGTSAPGAGIKSDGFVPQQLR
jgi:hypothetical protein